MSKYIRFTKLKHLIFPNGGSTTVEKVRRGVSIHDDASTSTVSHLCPLRPGAVTNPSSAKVAVAHAHPMVPPHQTRVVQNTRFYPAHRVLPENWNGPVAIPGGAAYTSFFCRLLLQAAKSRVRILCVCWKENATKTPSAVLSFPLSFFRWNRRAFRHRSRLNLRHMLPPLTHCARTSFTRFFSFFCTK
jgi:hypothetical protein